MKLKNVLLATFVLGGLLFASCKKDDSKDDVKNPNDNKVTDEYSSLTVEQNKANIEGNGLDLLNAVRTMETSASVRAAVNMSYYLERSFIFKNNTAINEPVNSGSFFKPVYVAASLEKFNARNAADDLKGLPDTTLVGVYKKVKGVYSWNYDKEEWNYSSSSLNNEIRIEFPSTREGKVNNVVFRVYDLLCEKGPFPWIEEYYGELPKQIRMELTVDNNVLLSYSFNAAYESQDKRPSSIKTSLTLSQFSLMLEAKNNNKNGSVSFSWKKDEAVLAMFSLNVNGDWTEENLNKEDSDFGDYITDGNVTLQLMNIRFVGKANVNAIVSKLINDKIDDSDSSAVASQCDFINNNADLSMCYVDNNLIIAKIIAYPSGHYSGEYDPQTGLETKEYEIGLGIKFKDGSKVNAKTYFGDGFDGLVQEAMIYYKDLMRKYRFYDK